MFFLFHVTYLLNTLILLRKHSLFSFGCVFSGHFSKHTLVFGSLAILQAKQSEGCKSFAPAFLQPNKDKHLSDNEKSLSSVIHILSIG